MKRLPLLLAATVVLTLGSSAAGHAQVVYPLPPYPYPVYADASVRIEATPRQAEVYVDGFYAGIVDDFDGVFQRLNIQPGQHEIALYLKGYHTVRQHVYLMPNHTFNIKQRLEPLAAGEVGEARPMPAPPQFAPGGPEGPEGPVPGESRPIPGSTGPRVPPSPPSPNSPPSPRAPDAPPTGQAGPGTLAIELQPADAEILIDGQPWPTSQRGERFVVDVPEGRHVIQVRKQGYVGYLTEVEVRRGETTTLTISLRAQQ